MSTTVMRHMDVQTINRDETCPPLQCKDGRASCPQLGKGTGRLPYCNSLQEARDNRLVKYNQLQFSEETVLLFEADLRGCVYQFGADRAGDSELSRSGIV
jgi:hypothetical protein